MFNVGDKAVYPAHGVGIIESIEAKKISGKEQIFYVMKILSNGMTIMIPTQNTETVGLRELISPDDIPRVYQILRKKETETDTQVWNRRYREYMGKIKTGSLFEVAAVFRDLYLLKMEKGLSFGERKILNMSRDLLIKELSIAKNSSEEVIRIDLEGILSISNPDDQ